MHMTHAQIADALEQAADYIDQYGWLQLQFADTNGAACAQGALSYGPELGREQRGLVCGAIAKHLDLPLPSLRGMHAPEHPATTRWRWRHAVEVWNDAPGRTRQQVVDGLRYAAKQEALLEEGVTP